VLPCPKGGDVLNENASKFNLQTMIKWSEALDGTFSEIGGFDEVASMFSTILGSIEYFELKVFLGEREIRIFANRLKVYTPHL
jgi:hypothetical protein